MNLLLPAFQLLYFVAHFLVSLALAVYDCYQQLVKILIPSPDISSAEIEVHAKYLKKLPQHLGLICIGSQVHRVSEILKLINWAIACNVNFISLYDARGVLKRESNTLVKALEESDVSVSFVINIPSFKQTLKVSGHNKMLDKSNLHSENDTLLRNLRTVTINVLSMENGQRNLAELAQKLALLGETEVSKEMIEKELVTVGQPDPDLVIIAGEPLTNMGFLPWQIRLSEFIAIQTLHKFDYNNFHKILCKFSKCEQRYGR